MRGVFASYSWIAYSAEPQLCLVLSVALPPFKRPVELTIIFTILFCWFPMMLATVVFPEWAVRYIHHVFENSSTQYKSVFLDLRGQ